MREFGVSVPRKALVLHLTSGNDPLLVAVPTEAAEGLATSLPDLIRRAEVENITTANGSSIAINFAHVLAAHVDATPGLGQIYGSVVRER
jgi:hypothetical protein